MRGSATAVTGLATNLGTGKESKDGGCRHQCCKSCQVFHKAVVLIVNPILSGEGLEGRDVSVPVRKDILNLEPLAEFLTYKVCSRNFVEHGNAPLRQFKWIFFV